jgi:hypothetical protein
MYGSRSFYLANYYSIEISPNLFSVSSVPEPSTLALFALGLLALGCSARLRASYGR